MGVTTTIVLVALSSLANCKEGNYQEYRYQEGRYQEFPQYDGGSCLAKAQCDSSALYRTYDGSCSSSGDPSWGMAGRPNIRTEAPVYQDGKSAPRLATDGGPLPNARRISTSLFQDEPEAVDATNTHAVMAWGQLIAHDVAHKRLKFPSVTKPCCTDDFQMLPQKSLHSECLPVEVPKDDEFYSKFGVRCLSFFRATPLEAPGCAGSPREQVNNVTHVIDGSALYGSDEQTANAMRTFANGRLKAEVSKYGHSYLSNDHKPAIPCQNPRSEKKCYFAGDERVNQTPNMVALTTALMRLHNHLADRLVALNPHWNDETTYQEARRIVWAFMQHVTYKEYLPALLGDEFVKQKGLLGGDGCVNYHDAGINPGVYHEFSGAAFRSFHSLVARQFKFVDKRFKDNGHINLDDYMFRPSFIEHPEAMAELMRGMAKQSCPKMDQHITTGLTNLFNKQNKTFGGDLEIFDIVCGRDMGITPYVKLLSLCGRGQVKDFDDLRDIMSKESIGKLSKIYSSVEDIDSFVGGMMERAIGGTMVGPTFQCIVGEQFYHFMRGDRFYYENCGLPWSFAEDQIQAIKQTSLAWMFCVTGDDVDHIQMDAFGKSSQENPIRLCKDIPHLDLSPWKQIVNQL